MQPAPPPTPDRAAPDPAEFDEATRSPGPMVVALGGNALIRPGEAGTPAQQYQRVAEVAEVLVALTGPAGLVVTHGNGPQVGVHLLRSELLKQQVPPTTLELAVAATQAEIGLMIVQAMSNAQRDAPAPRPVVAVVTRVLVSASDPAFQEPTKFVGGFMDAETAQIQAAELGWQVRRDGDRGWRRVVPSPAPQRVLEVEQVAALCRQGNIVVACGGGGVPVVEAHGRLVGVEAVVDKDRASAVLARALGASRMIILTAVDAVQRDYGTSRATPIHRIHADALRRLWEAGQFPAGSMGPKIEAALSFLDGGGGSVLITSPEHLPRALAGEGGTLVLP
ncbi:MAG: carbamate kinase [Deltaproteobacteria bacterium]|nr:MAG: carbamate kinase [Deltaproteobacteria bacterium]